jgi:hypothetical protein
MQSVLSELEILSRECKQFSVGLVTGHRVQLRMNGRIYAFVWRDGFVYRSTSDGSPFIRNNEVFLAMLTIAEHLMKASFAGYRDGKTKKIRLNESQLSLPLNQKPLLDAN